MTVAIKRMYRDETGHFKSLQYKNCGAGGMGAFGNQPYYGWDKTFLKKSVVYAYWNLERVLKQRQEWFWGEY
ncbi:hypothetical protein ACP6EV_16625 [Aeromonas hydrophila]|uniref:hypothetical protein n=1 Tax=Aeromonas hydrophila TaxID=644 RepID=UPI0013DECECD|nr:hypothetical protein [Aeromonas hydrophila]